MRKIGFVMALSLVAGTLSGSAAVAEDAPSRAVTVNIEGNQTVRANVGYTATYHFPDEPIKVAQGGTITFVNKTDDGHTITLVKKADLTLPLDSKRVDAAVLNNCKLCDAVNSLYFPGNGPPAGAQIDGGTIGDDDVTADADVTDTAALASASNPPPIPLLVEDFDTPGTGGMSPTVGDSTLIDSGGPNGHGGPTQRTVKMTPAPGTYFYQCTFHPWMEGSIIVEPTS